MRREVCRDLLKLKLFRVSSRRSLWYAKKTMRIYVSTIAILAAGILIAPRVLAHGIAFFSFTPEVTKYHAVATGATPSQSFEPQNDYLSGIDLWIAHPGPARAATVELRRENGGLLASQSILIPTTPTIWGGAPLHVDFERQISVSNTERYRLRVPDAPAELRLAIADRNQLLGHTSLSYPLTYAEHLAGPAYLGDIPQDFTFKFALYETRERTPPQISNLTTVAVNPEETRVEFNTNEPADYRADFGISEPYISHTPFLERYEFCRETISVCAVSLAVTPNTTYHYRLVVHDIWENESVADGMFRSAPAPPPPAPPSGGTQSPIPLPPAGTPLPSPPPPSRPPDTERPIISDLRIVSFTSQTVQISWRTNEASNSRLSILEGARSVSLVEDTNFELEHTLETPAVLMPKKSYTALVASYDPSGNVASARLPFETPEFTSTPAAPSSLQPPPSTALPLTTTVTAEGLNIARNMLTPEHTNSYRIDILDSHFALIAQRTLSAAEQALEINHLPAGTYRIVVYRDRGSFFEKVSEPALVSVGEIPVQPAFRTTPSLLILGGGAAGILLALIIIRKVVARRA